MSQIDAQAFVDKLKSDAAARGELSDLLRAEAEIAVLDYATKSGLSFTGPELVAAYQADLKSQGYTRDDLEDMAAAAQGDHGPYITQVAHYAGDQKTYGPVYAASYEASPWYKKDPKPVVIHRPMPY
jgi:hypothetical protein